MSNSPQKKSPKKMEERTDQIPPVTEADSSTVTDSPTAGVRVPDASSSKDIDIDSAVAGLSPLPQLGDKDFTMKGPARPDAKAKASPASAFKPSARIDNGPSKDESANTEVTPLKDAHTTTQVSPLKDESEVKDAKEDSASKDESTKDESTKEETVKEEKDPAKEDDATVKMNRNSTIPESVISKLDKEEENEKDPTLPSKGEVKAASPKDNSEASPKSEPNEFPPNDEKKEPPQMPPSLPSQTKTTKSRGVRETADGEMVSSSDGGSVSEKPSSPSVEMKKSPNDDEDQLAEQHESVEEFLASVKSSPKASPKVSPAVSKDGASPNGRPSSAKTSLKTSPTVAVEGASVSATNSVMGWAMTKNTSDDAAVHAVEAILDTNSTSIVDGDVPGRKSAVSAREAAITIEGRNTALTAVTARETALEGRDTARTARESVLPEPNSKHSIRVEKASEDFPGGRDSNFKGGKNSMDALKKALADAERKLAQSEQKVLEVERKIRIKDSVLEEQGKMLEKRMLNGEMKGISLCSPTTTFEANAATSNNSKPITSKDILIFFTTLEESIKGEIKENNSDIATVLKDTFESKKFDLELELQNFEITVKQESRKSCREELDKSKEEIDRLLKEVATLAEKLEANEGGESKMKQIRDEMIAEFEEKENEVKIQLADMFAEKLQDKRNELRECHAMECADIEAHAFRQLQKEIQKSELEKISMQETLERELEKLQAHFRNELMEKSAVRKRELEDLRLRVDADRAKTKAQADEKIEALTAIHKVVVIEKEETIEKLESKLSFIVEERDSILEDLKKKQAIITENTQLIEERNKKISHLESEKTTLENQKEEFLAQRTDYVMKIQEMGEETEGFAIKVETLEREFEDQKLKLEEQELLVETLKKDLLGSSNVVNTELEEKIKKLRQEMQHTEDTKKGEEEARIAAYVVRIQELEDANDRLLCRAESAEAELERLYDEEGQDENDESRIDDLSPRVSDLSPVVNAQTPNGLEFATPNANANRRKSATSGAKGFSSPTKPRKRKSSKNEDTREKSAIKDGTSAEKDGNDRKDDDGSDVKPTTSEEQKTAMDEQKSGEGKKSSEVETEKDEKEAGEREEIDYGSPSSAKDETEKKEGDSQKKEERKPSPKMGSKNPTKAADDHDGGFMIHAESDAEKDKKSDEKLKDKDKKEQKKRKLKALRDQSEFAFEEMMKRMGEVRTEAKIAVKKAEDNLEMQTKTLKRDLARVKEENDILTVKQQSFEKERDLGLQEKSELLLKNKELTRSTQELEKHLDDATHKLETIRREDSMMLLRSTFYKFRYKRMAQSFRKVGQYGLKKKIESLETDKRTWETGKVAMVEEIELLNKKVSVAEEKLAEQHRILDEIGWFDEEELEEDDVNRENLSQRNSALTQKSPEDSDDDADESIDDDDDFGRAKSYELDDKNEELLQDILENRQVDNMIRLNDTANENTRYICEKIENHLTQLHNSCLLFPTLYQKQFKQSRGLRFWLKNLTKRFEIMRKGISYQESLINRQELLTNNMVSHFRSHRLNAILSTVINRQLPFWFGVLKWNDFQMMKAKLSDAMMLADESESKSHSLEKELLETKEKVKSLKLELKEASGTTPMAAADGAPAAPNGKGPSIGGNGPSPAPGVKGAPPAVPGGKGGPPPAGKGGKPMSMADVQARLEAAAAKAEDADAPPSNPAKGGKGAPRTVPGGKGAPPPVPGGKGAPPVPTGKGDAPVGPSKGALPVPGGKGAPPAGNGKGAPPVPGGKGGAAPPVAPGKGPSIAGKGAPAPPAGKGAPAPPAGKGAASAPSGKGALPLSKGAAPAKGGKGDAATGKGGKTGGKGGKGGKKVPDRPVLKVPEVPTDLKAKNPLHWQVVNGNQYDKSIFSEIQKIVGVDEKGGATTAGGASSSESETDSPAAGKSPVGSKLDLTNKKDETDDGQPLNSSEQIPGSAGKIPGSASNLKAVSSRKKSYKRMMKRYKLNTNKLNTDFLIKKDATKGSGKGGERKSQSESNVPTVLIIPGAILDAKRRQALEIFLKTAVKGAPLEAIKTCTEKFDLKAVDPTMWERLEPMYPESEEKEFLNSQMEMQKTLKEENPGVTILPWSALEQYMLGLLEVEKFQLKRQCLQSMVKLPDILVEAKSTVEKVEKAAYSLKNSEAVKLVFFHLIQFGNYLNAGTAKGDCFGFNLDTLDKFANYMAPSRPQFSLVHFLLEELKENCHESIRHFLDDTKGCSVAEKIDLNNCKSEMLSPMKEMMKKLKLAVQWKDNVHSSTMESDSADKPIPTVAGFSDTFTKGIVEFIRENDTVVEKLAKAADIVLGELTSELKEMFCVADPALELKHVFKCFTEFRKKFEQAHRENIDRHLKEKKAQKELEKKQGKSGKEIAKQQERLKKEEEDKTVSDLEKMKQIEEMLSAKKQENKILSTLQCPNKKDAGKDGLGVGKDSKGDPTTPRPLLSSPNLGKELLNSLLVSGTAVSPVAKDRISATLKDLRTSPEALQVCKMTSGSAGVLKVFPLKSSPNLKMDGKVSPSDLKIGVLSDHRAGMIIVGSSPPCGSNSIPKQEGNGSSEKGENPTGSPPGKGKDSPQRNSLTIKESKDMQNNANDTDAAKTSAAAASPSESPSTDEKKADGRITDYVLKRTISPLTISPLASEVKIMPHPGPGGEIKAISPLEVSVTAIKAISPLELSATVSPLDAGKVVWPLEIVKTISPLEVQAISPLESGKGISPLDAGDETTAKYGSAHDSEDRPSLVPKGAKDLKSLMQNTTMTTSASANDQKDEARDSAAKIANGSIDASHSPSVDRPSVDTSNRPGLAKSPSRGVPKVAEVTLTDRSSGSFSVVEMEGKHVRRSTRRRQTIEQLDEEESSADEVLAEGRKSRRQKVDRTIDR